MTGITRPRISEGKRHGTSVIRLGLLWTPKKSRPLLDQEVLVLLLLRGVLLLLLRPPPLVMKPLLKTALLKKNASVFTTNGMSGELVSSTDCSEPVWTSTTALL